MDFEREIQPSVVDVVWLLRHDHVEWRKDLKSDASGKSTVVESQWQIR